MKSRRRALGHMLVILCATSTMLAACSSRAFKSGSSRNPNETERLPLKFESQTFGRFVGTLRHDQLDKDQYAKLDFIPARVAHTNQLEIKAVLSLHFGGFESQEYVSYHFEDVEYDLLTSKLVFNQSDQQLSLITSQFTADLLVADVHAGTKKIGVLTLNRIGAAPTRPTIGPVAGEYTGQCNGKDTALHLWTSRTTQEAGRVGNPFGTYALSGSLGDLDSGFCGNNTEKSCVVDIIREGSYDFFAASLHLTGKRDVYTCAVDGYRLDCGVCLLERSPPAADKLAYPPQSDNVLIDEKEVVATEQALIDTEATTAIAGEYFGFVHHERLNLYQRGKLDIQTFQSPGDGGSQLVMAATAQLIFGDAASTTAIMYSFNRQNYDLTSQVFLFERIADDVDAIIQVTSLGGGKVKGVWFSLQYGRVGTFEFHTAGYPTLPPGATPFNGIGGLYRSSSLELNVVPRIDATPVNSLNPFFPMNFGGFFRFPEALSEWVQIEDGSYDFYTGKIGFRMSREYQIVAGEFDPSSRQLRMTKPSRMISAYQESYEPETFVILE